MFIRKFKNGINSIRHNYTYTKIKDLSEKQVGNTINIKGWIKGRRILKEATFVDVNDGSCAHNLQVVIDRDLTEKPGHGSSINAEGILSTTPKGQLELKAERINVIGKCPLNDGFPFVPKQSYPAEYIREHLHLRSRVKSAAAIFRVRHHAAMAFCNFLNRNGMIQVHTPIITANVCEGGGEIFTVMPDSEKLLKEMRKQNVPLADSFFDRKTYLTVSGQLHLEAVAHGLGNVYTFGPAFRSENSKTPHHLAEFYMLEVELSFIESITEVCTFIETMTKQVTGDILNACEADIVEALCKKPIALSWLDRPFPIISYNEAISILQFHREHLKFPVCPEYGLAKDHELFLVKHIGGPVFVIDWPTEQKPFYMRQKKNQSNIVEALDFLVPSVGELAGGSMRENNYDLLKTKLPPHLEWYLDLRKYGSIPTGGFGLGFDRYLQLLLGVTNIKDVIPFPRWAHNCSM